MVTFDRHPATVVRPDSAPPLLTDLDQKLELLASTGVDQTVVITFDAVRSKETAEDFVLEVLVGALGARLVVVGEDFHFGHGRKGNVSVLSEMGGRHGFDVVGLALEPDGSGETVSSTRIRRALSAGDVRLAADLLGRLHEVRGLVVTGKGRGGSELLGFPTANVDIAPHLALPKEGIYACWYLRPDGAVHEAAVSFGRRPTFEEDGPPLLEAHLLEFDGDLYGEVARVSFVERLREERRFDDPADLVAAMTHDVESARVILRASPYSPDPAPSEHPC